jgi:hypothetical protein
MKKVTACISYSILWYFLHGLFEKFVATEKTVPINFAKMSNFVVKHAREIKLVTTTNIGLYFSSS